ncbi:MAG: MarR family transcriptional regulator [Rhodobacteraceae bacterium]|nr:MarR family transcriptional regulator [Paracoccaceae bacterium]
MDKDTAQTLYRFFTEVGIIYQLNRAMVEARLPGTMTATHFGLLGHLSRRPEGETPIQLAVAFQVPKTSMTHMLAVLEKRGLVMIGANPKDGRSKIVRITPDGGAFHQGKLEDLMPEMARVLELTGGDVYADVLPKLEEIREVLDRARDEA